MDALQEIFACWLTDANNMLSEDKFFNEVLCDLSADKARGGILTFVATPAHPQGITQVLHNIRKCQGPGANHRVVFACVGKVQKFNINVVKFLQDLLDTTTPASIHKDAKAHFTQLGAIPAGQPKMVGPSDHTANAALCKHDFTRNSMFLPVSLFPFVIGNDALPAGQAAKVLMAAI